MRLWAELRRRHVVRVADVDLVAAWLVMQVVAASAPAPGLPSWFQAAVFMLLALGALRRADLDRNGITAPSLWFPDLAETRRTQGFEVFVRDLRLVDYWRETGNWGDFRRPVGDDDFACR